MLSRIPTWGERDRFYQYLKEVDHPMVKPYWYSFIATLDQRERLHPVKKFTGPLAVFQRGKGDVMGTPNIDGKLLRGVPGFDHLIDQIRRGVTSTDGVVCADRQKPRSKRIDLKQLLRPTPKRRRANLNAAQKTEILDRHRRGFKSRQIADRMGISQSAVARVLKGGLA